MPKALAWRSTGSRGPVKTIQSESNEIRNTERNANEMALQKPNAGSISINRSNLIHSPTPTHRDLTRPAIPPPRVGHSSYFEFARIENPTMPCGYDGLLMGILQNSRIVLSGLRIIDFC